MSKIKISSIPKNERYKIIGEFLDIVSELKNKDEVSDFLLGLLTKSESLMMARRIQVARLVLEGKSYDYIRNELGISNQTIGRVVDWLNRDDVEFGKILEKYLKKSDKEVGNSVRRYTASSLLNKYPHHRFLRDLLDG